MKYLKVVFGYMLAHCHVGLLHYKYASTKIQNKGFRKCLQNGVLLLFGAGGVDLVQMSF